MAPLSSLHSHLHNIPSSPVVPHITGSKKPHHQNLIFCKTHQQHQDLCLNVEDGSLKVQRRGLLMHTVFGSLFAPAMVPLALAEEAVPEGYQIYTIFFVGV
ncbi:uncharacterized protein LOC118491529 [Helianthus annuus]|uniref:uncharacterized protein LOC118491529 n=1 Tax=Helianthus annuus TaxID=4232 RepID=UPI001652D256|nr:uncharacterized protein LOC118491529 [Helianthus annuus]